MAERYSEADVQLVAGLLPGIIAVEHGCLPDECDLTSDTEADGWRNIAKNIVAGLAAAGRLLPEDAAHLHRPFFYREKTNGVTLAVTYQGSDGLAFVAQPSREASEPYEQYGVVLPRDVVRALALRMLVSLQDPGSADG